MHIRLPILKMGIGSSFLIALLDLLESLKLSRRGFSFLLAQKQFLT